jgi:outer membrane protein TolC
VSLYLRGPDGRPIRPGPDRLPDLPRPAGADEPDEAAEIQAALERRPELAALRAKQRQQQVALRAAENQVLPALDLFSEFARDFGTGPDSRAGSSFQGGITFEWPVQRRKAVGKSLQVQAKLSALTEELRWAEDRVRADVQDALSALRAARAILDVVTEELQVTRELESLERDRFALGDSTQFLVNLRELASADAAVREARALADFQKARVRVDAATGRLLDRVP